MSSQYNKFVVIHKELNQMDYNALNELLGKTDIYLIDQVMKSRYNRSELILDAGCGKGRNLIFLSKLGFEVEGCDQDGDIIDNLRNKKLGIALKIAELSSLPYLDNRFDHIICNAVLHFAESEEHFISMINELSRTLKIGGTLFVRMTSIFGLSKYKKLGNGQYQLEDGTTRFLLDDDHLSFLKINYKLMDPIKTVNVDNLRCMSTLMLKRRYKE